MAELARLLAEHGGEFWQHQSQDLIGLIDPAGRILGANDRLAGIASGSGPAGLGDLLPEPDRPRWRQILVDAIAASEPIRSTLTIAADPGGAPVPHACWITRVRGDRLLLIAEPVASPVPVDVDDAADPAAARRELSQVRGDLAATRQALDEAIAQIGQMSQHDALTGLANHHAALSRLEEEIARAGRHDRPLSVLLIDLDHFRYVNDTHGHQVGDAVLRQTAGILNGVIRRSDTLGRYGGEEFLAVLPETDLAAGRLLAERLRRHVEASHYAVAGHAALAVTVSIGVATLAAPTDTIAGLLARANQALQAAKSAGRNRVGVGPV